MRAQATSQSVAMSIRTLISITFLIAASVSSAQIAGNASFGQGNGRARAEQAEHAKRSLAQYDIPAEGTMYLDASVLMNIPADEYVAVFALSTPGATPEAAVAAMDANLAKFRAELGSIGIAPKDIAVDFIAQAKTYDYKIEGDVAKEELTGFEMKKNVSIRYSDPHKIDALLLAAGHAGVYDLVKVDYVLRDMSAVRARLLKEAAAVIHEKAAQYESLLGTRLRSNPAVYTDRQDVYYPSQMYDSYVAAEAENVERDVYRSKYMIVYARKNQTYYYNPLSGDGFDKVVNPTIMEPPVQCTIYLKLRYERQPASSVAAKPKQQLRRRTL
jgi:uncharacterized protein YggE